MKKLALFALAAFLVTGVSMTASAEDTRSLTQQQRDALVQHAKSVTPEKRQQLREDPASRSQFVRNASASLPPDQRKDLQARFQAMTEQQRGATLRSVFEEAQTRYQTSRPQDEARSLSQQQRDALVQHAKSVSPEKRQQLRDDPASRPQFVREASLSLSPEMRNDMMARFSAMTEQQRGATLRSVFEEAQTRYQTSRPQDEARSLSQQQRDALVQHARSVTPEKRQQLRDDPASRPQFVREASLSLSPEMRNDMMARFSAMTEQQRGATLRSVFEEAQTRYQTSRPQDEARSLSQQQRDALVQHAKSVSPEKRQQLRDDPASRPQFVRDASASLPPDQRKDLQARFQAMTEQQRGATLRSVFEEAQTRYQTSRPQ